MSSQEMSQEEDNDISKDSSNDSSNDSTNDSSNHNSNNDQKTSSDVTDNEEADWIDIEIGVFFKTHPENTHSVNYDNFVSSKVKWTPDALLEGWRNCYENCANAKVTLFFQPTRFPGIQETFVLTHHR